MHRDKRNPESTMDAETGEISLRVCDGMVNNYCETIIQSLRCNMDVNFIGSGKSAKAIVYYITDYITKMQLKAHVSYSALKAGVEKMREQLNGTESTRGKARRLPLKRSNALLSHQELSAQQVTLYLLGYSDKITSHRFRMFSWIAFELIPCIQPPTRPGTWHGNARQRTAPSRTKRWGLTSPGDSVAGLHSTGSIGRVWETVCI